LIPKYFIKTEHITGKFEDSEIKTCKNSVCIRTYYTWYYWKDLRINLSGPIFHRFWN